MGSRRIRLTVRYDGTDFAGSQIQPGARTVAGTLKTELESALGGQVHLLFAGRTDSGVHAEGNVCAFDADPPFPVERLPQVVGASLPRDLDIRDAREVRPDFHPRFDARRRTYVYRLYLGSDVPMARKRYVAAESAALDQRALTAAAQAITGRRSFMLFSKGPTSSEDAVCDLQAVAVESHASELHLRFTADRFLRHMVRLLVGAMLSVASGSASVRQLRLALAGQQEFQLRLMPPRGLTLMNVEYPAEEPDDD
jgi:tRNA pseudouridine38-40 synthase